MSASDIEHQIWKKITNWEKLDDPLLSKPSKLFRERGIRGKYARWLRYFLPSWMGLSSQQVAIIIKNTDPLTDQQSFHWMYYMHPYGMLRIVCTFIFDDAASRNTELDADHLPELAQLDPLRFCRFYRAHAEEHQWPNIVDFCGYNDPDKKLRGDNVHHASYENAIFIVNNFVEKQGGWFGLATRDHSAEDRLEVYKTLALW